MSVTNMWPGAWVIISGGFEAMATACGVTPQAQKTGTSSAAGIQASPKSGFCVSLMPIADGSPICTGAPWTAGKRDVAWTARTTLP